MSKYVPALSLISQTSIPTSWLNMYGFGRLTLFVLAGGFVASHTSHLCALAASMKDFGALDALNICTRACLGKCRKLRCSFRIAIFALRGRDNHSFFLCCSETGFPGNGIFSRRSCSASRKASTSAWSSSFGSNTPSMHAGNDSAYASSVPTNAASTHLSK